MTSFLGEVVDIAQSGLSCEKALAFISDDAFGGMSVFLGRVRAANLGRVVTGIHYDMFDPLTLRTFETAAEQAKREFGPAMKVYVAHAKGQLKVGELAVIVAVGTPHRDEAFRACRLVIEYVKHQAPIWKQEHYIDGSSIWSEGCTLCPSSEHNHPAATHHHHGHDHAHTHDK